MFTSQRFAFALAGFLLACAGCTIGQRPDAATRRYRAGVSPSAKKAFLDESGAVRGLYVDVFREAATRAGVQFDFVWLEARDVDDALKRGEIDLHVAVSDTLLRRRKHLYLAEPWWESPLIVIVPARSPVKRTEELRGKRVAVASASAGYWDQFFSHSVPGAIRMDATAPNNPVAEMCRGHAAGALMVSTDAEVLLAMHPPGCREDGFRFLPGNGQKVRYSLVSLPENRAVCDRINREIRAMAIDGTLAKAVRPWLGLNSTAADGIGQEIVSRRRFALTVAIAIAVLVAAISISLGLLLWHQRRANRRVADALDRARRGEQAKAQFLATMSHEVRTPLNGVLGMTELLLTTPLTAEQRDAAFTIQRSSAALLTVLNDVLDFCKLEAGRVSISRELFELRLLLEDVVSLVAVRAAEKHLPVYVDVAADVPNRVEGDPGRIRQVLLNLLGNAVKFTDRGSLHLEVRLNGPVQDGQALFRFAVKDTGPGIAGNEIPLLFRKFSQLNSSGHHQGGTGLGLAISQALVKAMGGTIEITSEVGRGSVFAFELLLSASGDDPRPLEGRRVRIAGRDAELVRCLRQLASAAGAEVTETRVDVTAWVRSPADGDQPEPGEAPGDPAPKLLPASVSFTNLIDALRTSNLPQAASPTSTQPPRHILAGLTVLVAEDNAVNRKVLGALLDKLGCRVIEAHNGREAVEVWRARQPDVVLMDCQMPELTGYEAARLIRKEQASRGLPRCPIWAVTANVFAEDRTRCLDCGMNDILPKPFTFAQLSAALAAAPAVQSKYGS